MKPLMAIVWSSCITIVELTADFPITGATTLEVVLTLA
jgi:hypothetical protein